MKATVTNTAGIAALVMNAQGRNRAVYEKKFLQAVDPSGTHIMVFQMIHNEDEMRTQWLCKMRGSEDPASIWLDVDLDILNHVTTEIEVSDEPPSV